jgi:hypothetical protein
MLSEIRQYITEMGITENFYQQMVNTDPSQMVVYGEPSTAEERERHKLLGIRNTLNNWKKLIPEADPVHQEIDTSYDARKYGVTTSQMRQREIDAKWCETRDKDLYVCQEALKWGLSEGLYRERSEKAAKCWADEDVKIVRAISKKERRDHPSWIKMETCTRNIMLGGS